MIAAIIIAGLAVLLIGLLCINHDIDEQEKILLDAENEK